MLSACGQKSKFVLQSPDGTYTYTLKINRETSEINYNISFQGEEIIGNSGLGFVLSENAEFGAEILIEDVVTKSVNNKWVPVYGERNEYPDEYNEGFITFTGNKEMYALRIRAYNEGVAFRYEFGNGEEDIHIKEENTEFDIPAGAYAWVSTSAQDEISRVPVSEIREAKERPILIQYTDSLFVAIGEAALVDYARMRLINKEAGSGVLMSHLDGEVKLDKPFNTPWRFVMAARQAGQLLEHNYLLLNLNEPNKIKDPSWIKPGKVIREVTLTTRGGKACVDFASRHNLQYIEFDAGWYGYEYDDASDATTVTVDPKRSKGPLDLPGVIQYANSKDIGVILYVNRRALEKQLDDVLPLLRSWGVKGVKYGFVNVGSQEWTGWLHDAVRKAADHELMIDIHDEYRPTGYSRTYPNLMTQEGIRGDEESPENAAVLNTLFTRMLAGAGDQTNCYFTPRVHEKMGSHASQLAKVVCIYSPWQFLYWYDRPEGSDPEGEGAGGSKRHIMEVPELEFFDNVPTVWDETKVIHSEVGVLGTVARRNGDNWFIGTINGKTDRQVEIELDFLTPNKEYEATVYYDDPEVLTVTHVGIERMSVNNHSVIDREIKANNGMAIHISPVFK
jgi:alpha-glucosidase